VPSTFRRKTSPRPRAFRLAVPVVVGEAGRRAACPEPAEGAFVWVRATVGLQELATMSWRRCWRYRVLTSEQSWAILSVHQANELASRLFKSEG